MKPAPKHTVFLDRDGVINEDSPDYIKSWEEFRFIEGSRSAIADFTSRGFRVFVISNQSGVNRGLFSHESLEGMHRRLTAAVRQAGGRIDGIYFCPHRPEEDCNCRKPRPGLIRQASREHGIDLSTAVMVGDSVKDIVAGRRAGCALSVLVRTGGDKEAEVKLAAAGVFPDHIAADLKSAAGWIINLWTRSTPAPAPSSG